MPPSDEPYDEQFYDDRVGPVPYRREAGVWLELFGGLADAIVERLSPARVLDVGCAKGFLVECLRDRGVDAVGLDPSTYAVGAASPTVRPFLTVGRVRDLPADDRYDLVTCLEVLEHLPAEEGDDLLDALTARADRVLFSSTPDDYDEPTHVNVQPPTHWIERFAARGFAPVPGVDFAAFAPHTMLFARGASTASERRLYADWVARAGALAALRTQLAEAETREHDAGAGRGSEIGPGTRRALRLLGRVVPPGSRRRRIVKAALSPRRPGPAASALAPLRDTRRRPRLLIVSGCGGDSRRYRCDHLLEAAATIGGTGVVLEDDPAHLSRLDLDGCADVLILHRARATEPLAAAVADARRRGVPVVFDTDDLTFDPDLDLAAVPGLGALLADDSVARQRQALGLADAAWCTNAFLAERLAACGVPARVLKNGWSRAMLAAADAARAEPAPRGQVIGYASGTATHDADFARCAPGVAELLETDPRRRLHLIGPLDPGARVTGLGARVVRFDLVPWRTLPRLLAGLRVNLAPLDLASPFCRSKSEIKWLEAALVGVPTVASPAPAYAAAIRDGDDGLLAATTGAWRDQVERLLDDPQLAAAVGAAARVRALSEYGPKRRGLELRRALEELTG